jgi:fluoride exporter
MTLLGIALAGAAGALARYGISGLVHRSLGAGFPWGTLSVNLIGCCLLGFLLELSRQSGWVSPEFRTIAGIGFLGAFTTFSTFGVETYRAFETGDWLVATLNVLVNVVGGLLLVASGSALARFLAQFVRFIGQTGGGS